MYDDGLAGRAGRTVVLGAGNVLMGDEGIGVRVVQALAHCEGLEDVDLVEGGTGGLDLLFAIEGYACAVIVDAADMGDPPGTVRALAGEDLEEAAPARHAHGFGVGQVLQLGQVMRLCPPRVLLVGIQPERVRPGPELSESVAGALAEAVECVRGVLGARGPGPMGAEQGPAEGGTSDGTGPQDPGCGRRSGSGGFDSTDPREQWL